MSGRNREFNEDKVLEKAAEVFWLKGYEASSTENLLQAMDLNKGSMYNAFGGKRELFILVFQWFAKHFIQNMKTIFNKHDNPLDAIKEVFYGVARTKDNLAHTKGCFYVNILGEMSGMDEELVAMARKNLFDVESLFQTEIKKGITKGFIDTSMNPAIIAKYLVNLWNGLSITRRMYPGKDLEKLVSMNLQFLEKG